MAIINRTGHFVDGVAIGDPHFDRSYVRSVAACDLVRSAWKRRAVAEIRRGLISGAVDAGDAVYYSRVLCIIGSETSFAIALSTASLRDKLARRLGIFLAVRFLFVWLVGATRIYLWLIFLSFSFFSLDQIYQTGKPDAGYSLAIHGSAAHPLR
jgi:hypothetical protein